MMGVIVDYRQGKNKLEKLEKHVEDIALVDTSHSVTIVDGDIANKVGVTHLKRTLTLTIASSMPIQLVFPLLCDMS